MTRAPIPCRLSLALLAFAASGCQPIMYFVRDPVEPVRAIEVRVDPTQRRSCLVVLMPGLMDVPDHFFEHGFVADARRASDRCDLVVVDAHLGYYSSGVIAERIDRDILRIAETRGYREAWLVGISMGSLGAVLAAREGSHLVRGLVLLAPWLGDEALAAEVVRGGGLRPWTAPPIVERPTLRSATEAVLAWLQGYATHPERMPELYVGAGTEDRLLPHAALPGELLAPERFDQQPGGHDWRTWRALWGRLLRDPPWDRAARE